MSDVIGLTNFIEGIVVNQLGQFNFGRNQFDLVKPDCQLIRDVAARLNITTATHDPFLRTGNILTPVERNDAALKNSSYVFLNKSIDIETEGCRTRLEQLVREIRRERAGSQGRFPYILPSRNKVFR